MASRFIFAALILLGFGAARLYTQKAAPAAEVGETERVIVTGSNIPTAEEVGPAPVDTYRTEDIKKLGARTATDLTQRLPSITGFGVNENISNGGAGRTEVNLRGLFPKETLILVDGRRVAPVGFAMNSSVDLNLIPFPLVDHIDILKDGASAIYGSDAIGGVINIFLKHKFRGLEIEDSYGNTNLGASNDAAQREGYILAGTGDDKTNIVIFAQAYDRAAIFSRDRNISRTGTLRSVSATTPMITREYSVVSRASLGCAMPSSIPIPRPLTIPSVATSTRKLRSVACSWIRPRPALPRRGRFYYVAVKKRF